MLLSEQRDTTAARRFFTRALRYGPAPVEVTTDKAAPYLRVVDELVPDASHVTEQYGNNRIEADHSRLKARLRPMRGLKQVGSAARLAAGHALVQNLRRGQLRTRHRRPTAALPGGSIQRARAGYVTCASQRPTLAPARSTQQTPYGRPAGLRTSKD
jgi:transposase-like protein